MPLVEHRLRVRNRADSADLLVANSVRGDTDAYLVGTPDGDGASFNPLSQDAYASSYRVRVSDEIKTGTSRVVSSLLEDGNARPQMGYHKAYVEKRVDGGAYATLVAGFVTVLRATSDGEFEFTIQDASRLQSGIELFSAAATTSIASFLSTWPNRGLLFGGPIMGSFMTMPDWQGWRMKVHEYTVGARTRYWLEPISTYGPNIMGGRAEWTPAGFNPGAGQASWKPGPDMTAFSAGINQIGQGLSSGVREINYGLLPFSTIADTYARGVQFPGFVLLINGTPFRVVDPYHAESTSTRESVGYNDLVSDGNGGVKAGVYALLDGQTALTDGSIVRVRGLTILPSDASPIYLDSHPVDILTTSLTAAGIAYDSTAATALKQKLGTDRRFARRITGTHQLGPFLLESVYRPFQIATRVNSTGQLVPFSTMIFNNTPPTKTITDALVVDRETSIPYEIDVGQGLQRVTMRMLQYLMLVNAPDGVGEIPIEMTLLNGDASALPSGTLDIDVPGMIHTQGDATPVDIVWFAGFVAPLFDRFGRGNQTLVTALLRGDGTTDADTVDLGDELLITVKQVRNHNKRYGDDSSVGARAMQITRLTERLADRLVTLSDSGPNAQAITDLPTHTIAASTDLPRTVAEVTITNAATLNASGYALRLQVAVTTGSTPASTDYVDVYRYNEGAIPTTAIRLPAVIAGRKVYARARTEKTGQRESAYQTAVSVTLTAIDAPTSLTATPVVSDGSLCDLAWTIGANAGALFTDIYIRTQGAAFSTASIIDTLPPGSNRFRIEQLTPGALYTASVVHRDLNTQDISAIVDVNFTAGATAYTLNAPTTPRGFSGGMSRVAPLRRPTSILQRTARYGIAVVSTEYPSYVEVAEAIETAPGAGTYGAYVEGVGKVEATASEWTQWEGFAPNDGRRRRLKARHVREGATNSVYTSEVTVSPWTIEALAAYGSGGEIFYDDRYVKRAGDTMTGTLDLDTVSTARLILPVGVDQWAT